MPKQTRLGEDADIYQPRQEQTEKEKLRDMPFKKRFSYLWEYYRFHALITIGAIALVAYIIYGIVTPDIKPKFYAAIINNNIDQEVIDQYGADFAKYLQLNPKTQSVVLNTSFYFNSSYDSMNMKQVLTTYIAAQEVDVIIAPESEFYNYAYYGYLDKLSDQLPTDIYSSLTDNFYITGTENDAENNVYGIYVDDTEFYKKNAITTNEKYIIGVVANSKHRENTIEFIRYLFGK